jgi:hypothetical protein
MKSTATVMDADATESERKQFEKQDVEDRIYNASIEEEIAIAKKEVPQSEFSPFDGTDEQVDFRLPPPQR